MLLSSLRHLVRVADNCQDECGLGPAHDEPDMRLIVLLSFVLVSACVSAERCVLFPDHAVNIDGGYCPGDAGVARLVRQARERGDCWRGGKYQECCILHDQICCIKEMYFGPDWLDCGLKRR